MRRLYNHTVELDHSPPKVTVLPSTSNTHTSGRNGQGKTGSRSPTMALFKGGNSSDAGNVYDFDSDSDFDNKGQNVVARKSPSRSTLTHPVQDNYVGKSNGNTLMQGNGKGKAGKLGHVKNGKDHVGANCDRVNANVKNGLKQSGNSTAQAITISVAHSLQGTLRPSDGANCEEDGDRQSAQGKLHIDSHTANEKNYSHEQGRMVNDDGKSQDKVVMPRDDVNSQHEVSGENAAADNEGRLHEDTSSDNIAANSEEDSCTPDFVLNPDEGASEVVRFGSESTSAETEKRQSEVHTGDANVEKLKENAEGPYKVTPVIDDMPVHDNSISQQGTSAEVMPHPAVGANVPLPIGESVNGQIMAMNVVNDTGMDKMPEPLPNVVGGEMTTIAESGKAVHGDLQDDIELNNGAGPLNNSAEHNTSRTPTSNAITYLHWKSGAGDGTVKVGNMSSEGMDSSSDSVSTDDTYDSIFITQKSPVPKSVKFRSQVGNGK